LGRVTPLYKGDYSASASYELNDVVLYNGNLYWHVQATPTVGILPTDTTVWKLAFADEGVRAEIRGYADNAQNSANSAQASKSAAAQSASQASASASQAALSAQTAQTAETGAAASAQTASAKASEASASAQSAASSEQTATDKATLASQKAAAASESASLATAKATAAATSETNAAASAQTAITKASEAAASATSAQEYNESAQQSAVNAQTSATNAAASEAAAKRYAEDSAAYLGAYPTDTAEGEIASFSDGADDVPVKSLVVGIEPVQSGEGDPSPTNVRPISGWTGCNISRVGRNLFGGLEFAQKIGEIANLPSYSIDTNNKTFTFRYAQPKDVRAIFKLKTPTRITAIITYKNNGNNQSIIFRYTDGDFFKLPLNNTNGNKTTLVYTNYENKLVDNVALSHYADASTTVYYDESGFFDGVATASDFIPYAGNLYHITFPTEAGTVYGGTFDVLSGVLTVTKGFIQSYNGEALPSPWISDRDVYAQGATPTTGAEVCYTLAEPITYQLTPNEVKSLLGQNNIWADTGDTTVEYRADTSAYIAKKIAEAISALS
jgi:hypothetical protein